MTLNFSRIITSALLAAAALTGTCAQAGVLLGTGGLEKSADLTRIATASGTLEFLDLTTTQGWTIEDALFGYAPQGFRVAGGDEIRELMGAFGIAYFVTGDYMAELDATGTQSKAFVDHVSATWGDAAYGISYEAGRNMYMFSCIAIDNCGEPANYIAMEDYTYGNELMGFYLVRDAVEVPLPATPALFGAALLAVAALRRRAPRIS